MHSTVDIKKSTTGMGKKIKHKEKTVHKCLAQNLV